MCQRPFLAPRSIVVRTLYRLRGNRGGRGADLKLGLESRFLSPSLTYITYKHTLPGILVVGLYTQPALCEVGEGLSCLG